MCGWLQTAEAVQKLDFHADRQKVGLPESLRIDDRVLRNDFRTIKNSRSWSFYTASANTGRSLPVGSSPCQLHDRGKSGHQWLFNVPL